MRTTFTRDLRRQIVLFLIIITLVSIISVALIGYYFAKQTIQNGINERLSILVEDRSNSIKRLLNRDVQQLENLATHEHIQTLVGEYNRELEEHSSSSSKDKSLIEKLKQDALEREIPDFIVSTADKSKFQSIKIVGQDGQTIINSSYVITGKNNTELQYNEKINLEKINEPSYYIGFDKKINDFALIISAPIFDRTDHSKPIGAIIASRDLSLINEILTDRSYLDKTGETYLVYKDTSLITDSRFIKDHTTVHVNTFPVVECFQHNKSIAGSAYPDYRGIPVFGSSVCDKDVGLVTLAEFDEAEILAPINELRDHYLVASIALAMILTLFVILLSRPITKIVKLEHELNETLKKANLDLEEKEKILTKANEELVEIERSKEEFISMISHELKTPLVPIKGYSEMLLKPKILGEVNDRQKKAVQTILKSSQKLESLVQDMLDIYKLDMGKMRFAKSDVSVNDLVMNLVNDLKPMMSDKNVDLISDIKTSGTVYCDAKRIDQVLANLVKNAVDFVPEKGGKIAVRVQDYNHDGDNGKANPSSQVLFSVEDNGIGIPPEKVDSLFQKFYQADTSPTRKHGGSGLGLPICKGIVEAHGGKIWLDKTYRSGASVVFTLPRKEEGERNNSS